MSRAEPPRHAKKRTGSRAGSVAEIFRPMRPDLPIPDDDRRGICRQTKKSRLFATGIQAREQVLDGLRFIRSTPPCRVQAHFRSSAARTELSPFNFVSG